MASHITNTRLAIVLSLLTTTTFVGSTDAETPSGDLPLAEWDTGVARYNAESGEIYVSVNHALLWFVDAFEQPVFDGGEPQNLPMIPGNRFVTNHDRRVGEFTLPYTSFSGTANIGAVIGPNWRNQNLNLRMCFQPWVGVSTKCQPVLRVEGPMSIANTSAGDVDFLAGQNVISKEQLLEASKGEPFPFDGTYLGSDDDGTNFSAEWSQTFDVFEVIQRAVLDLGITDLDSDQPGDQVASFVIDGIDLTEVMNSVLRLDSTLSNQASNVRIEIPIEALDILRDGKLNFFATIAIGQRK